ncbi:MAG TPA: MoaD/ThiS family protein [Rhizomicrobium sp.]|jgi:molybdopterin converting factor small subunit
MSVHVQLPPVLRSVAGGARRLEANGRSIAAVLSDLAKRHPTLGLHLFDEQGAIRRNIVFLHAGDMVRAKDAGARQIADGDEIVLTNALAGG